MGTACECDWFKTGREEQVRPGGQGGQAGMEDCRGRNHGVLQEQDMLAQTGRGLGV